MVSKSFILGNLVCLCRKIINSVVVVGLYYGFLTTFSMGPSYLFLLRAQVIEEGEEGTEKKIATTTGFLMGQLLVFISIYYAPLHLALGRPHTITVLALPYLLFHFFWKNHQHFFDYGSTTRNSIRNLIIHGSTTRNSMRNLSIQCVFLNNLIFPLFNHFFLPSSMVVRLVNIYMFRCNNKMLFVTSSFVAWLIGHIFFMKWVGLIVVWIQEKSSLRSKRSGLLRVNKYLVSELRNSMARIFSILFFITCVYALGRSPIFFTILTMKLTETSETEESEESEEETDVEIETTSEMKGTKKEQEGSTEEEESSSFFLKEGDETFFLDGNQENSKFEILLDNKDKDPFWFEKLLVTSLSGSQRWPFQYIKNDEFKNAVKKAMSQYFFDTCQSDGKERISFTYPPSLSTFLEIIQGKMSLFTTEKLASDELYNNWNFNNEQKKKNLSNEFRSRVEASSIVLLNTIDISDTIEKRIRLYYKNYDTDQIKAEYLPTLSDPFFNAPSDVGVLSSSRRNELSIQNNIGLTWINKLHLLFLRTSLHFPKMTLNFEEFEPKKDRFNQQSFLTKIGYFLHLINKKDEKMDLENRIKILKPLFNAVIADYNNKTILKKSTEINEISNGIKEISKKIPHYENKEFGEVELSFRNYKRIVFYTIKEDPIDRNADNNSQEADDRTHSDKGIQEALMNLAFIFYKRRTDFRRYKLKASPRTHRRKTPLCLFELGQAKIHSPFFVGAKKKRWWFFALLAFDFNIQKKILLKSLICKEFGISDYTYRKDKTTEIEELEMEKKELKMLEEKLEEKGLKMDKEKLKMLEEKLEEKGLEEFEAQNESLIAQNESRIAQNESRIEGVHFTDEIEKGLEKLNHFWEDHLLFGQAIRSILLISQAVFRKYIVLPSLITAKNIIRILLLRRPEWSEDFKDWSEEGYVICTFNGVPLSDREFPRQWQTEGLQIRISDPFRLKPWHKSEQEFPHKDKDPMQNKRKKNFIYLTVLGTESHTPCCGINLFFHEGLAIFSPIVNELNLSNVIKIIIHLVQIAKNLINTTKSLFFVLFPKARKNKLSKSKSGFREIYELNERKNEIYELNERKNEKDPTITTEKISIPIRSMDGINFSHKERKMKALNARTTTIRNQIEQITKEKKKRLKSLKNIWKIVYKSYFFTKIWIERIYIDILLVIINILRINIQFFFESTSKSINKCIYNNKENPKRIAKTNPNKFISIIKKSSNLSLSNKNSHIFSDISSLSQAYVFYKLSQTQVINLYKLRFVLQYRGAFLFLKNEIKDYFEAQGLFQSELKDPNFRFNNSVMNQWKNWLKSHYQYKYNLSQIYWYKLIPQKWRIRITQRGRVQNQDLNKWNLYKKYKKDQVIHYEKQKKIEVDSLPNKKANFQKYYKFHLFSYQFLNSADKKDSSIYGLPLQENKISYNYNYKTDQNKSKVFDMLGGISINNYLAEDDIINLKKNPDRQYFDWRVLDLCKADLQAWIHTGTKKQKNTKTGNNMYQIMEKVDNKDLFFVTFRPNQEVNSSKKKKKPFDWMGMNEEILNLNVPISTLDLERWFFPKFWRLYNVYKMKPWATPINLLLFNSNFNENEKNEKQPVDLIPVFANREKDVKEDYAGSDTNKQRTKKQYESNMAENLYCDFVTNPGFCFQLREDAHFDKSWRIFLEGLINVLSSIYLFRQEEKKYTKTLTFFLSFEKQKTLTEYFLSFLKKGELSLDLMPEEDESDLFFLYFMTGGRFMLEPTCLSVKNDGKSIMYQTISLFLIHKSKQQVNPNPRYREKNYLDKTESIQRHQSITGNGDKKDYDLFVLENLLSPKHRRKLRILISLNSKNKNDIHRNPKIFNGNNVKNCDHIIDKSKLFDGDNKDKNKFIKLKLFLWPNYRLEDLACMNRYWFNTNNASRFSMLRIRIYPRLKI